MTLQSSACHMSDFSKVNAASPTRSHGLVDSLVDSLRACVFDKVDFRLSAFLYIYCMSVYYMLCFELFLIVSGQITFFFCRDSTSLQPSASLIFLGQWRDLLAILGMRSV